jgi:O-antigen/teichoic acid export membrane protein
MSNLTVVKNAFANLCRGGAIALSMLLLPPFLARILSKDAYGTWLLILQLSTYVSLLDLGIQTVIGKFVAYYNELGEFEKRDSIVSSAIALLTGSGLLAIIGISFLSWQLPYLFQAMPASLRQDAQLSLLYVGWSLAVSLPFSVFGAVFLGLQRYDVPAWIIGISRLLAGFFVVLVAYFSHSIMMMAIVVGVTNLGAGIWQFLAYKRMIKGYCLSPAIVSKESIIEVAESCLALSVSSLGLLLVSGLDTTIIGFFDYGSVPYYALASTLTNFVFGISSAILNTVIPVASSISARNEPESLGTLVTSTTRYAVIILIATNLPLLLLSKELITLWVGSDYADKTSYILELLIAANFVRQVGSPYFMIAIGCGEHRKIILSPLIEALVNLLFSIILTAKMGVIGVAIGTLVGGFVSIGMHFFYNLPRTKKIFISNKTELIYSIIKPIMLIFLPTIFLSLLSNQSKGNTFIFTILVPTFLILVSWTMLWSIALDHKDRNVILSAIKKVVRKK